MRLLRSFPSLFFMKSIPLKACSLVLSMALSTTFLGCHSSSDSLPSPPEADATTFVVIVKDVKSRVGFSREKSYFAAELDVDGEGETEKIDLGKDAVWITAMTVSAVGDPRDHPSTALTIGMSKENITKLHQELNKDAVKKNESTRIKVQLKLMTNDGSKTATLWSAKLFAVLEGYGGKKTLPETTSNSESVWQGQKAAAKTFALYTKSPANDGEKSMLYNELQKLTAQ